MTKLQLIWLALLIQTLSVETLSSIESKNTEYQSLEGKSNSDFHDNTDDSFAPDMERAVSQEKIFKDEFSTTYEIRHGNVDVSATVENPNAPPDWEEEWRKNGSNKESKNSTDTTKKENNKRKKGSSFSVSWSSKN